MTQILGFQTQLEKLHGGTTDHEGLVWDKRGQSAIAMAAKGSRNRDPHRRIPAKKTSLQKKTPPSENNWPYDDDEQKTHHDTNTSRKPDSTTEHRLKVLNYCFGRVFASGEG